MIVGSRVRPWPEPLAPAWWGLRALRREVFGFRFDYPIETVVGAGPRESLRYYVYSDRLFFDAMELDERGIPMHRSRTFRLFHNPAYVSWYGLVNLERSLRGLDPGGARAFLDQAAWLEANVVRRPDGGVVWPYTVSFQEGRCVLAAPWICAMAQGLAMSTLVRAHRLMKRGRLLDLARAATRVFEIDVKAGGVRTTEGRGALYEEYPGYPLPRVLDGFLFSLLGLHDVAVETGDPAAERLFSEGIEGLTDALTSWDYRGKWSWYGTHGYLCPPHYNTLNAALLASLARVSGEPALAHRARAWDPPRRRSLDRVEVFVAFVVTKNLSRLRHLTWRQRTHGVGVEERERGAHIPLDATLGPGV